MARWASLVLLSACQLACANAEPDADAPAERSGTSVPESSGALLVTVCDEAGAVEGAEVSVGDQTLETDASASPESAPPESALASGLVLSQENGRGLDEAFPEQAPALIEAAFSQPNTLWFGFVICGADGCEVVLELSLLNGGGAIERPSETALDRVRERLERCAPYVAENLNEITFFDVPPL